MNLDLSGRHALVCGASKGIGRATADELEALGARVTRLSRSGPFVADLDDHEALVPTIRGLVAEGPVHILINNTGGPKGGPLTEAPVEALRHAFKRHVLSAQILMQLCLPGMKETGYGRIVNVLSTSVREPIPNLGVSNTIRGAMASWSKTLSRELPPGITINNVLPGFTDTDRLSSLKMARAQRQGVSPESVEEAWMAQTPESRLGLPQELGGAIAFLCSPAGAFIRGVNLPVDGGRLRSI